MTLRCHVAATCALLPFAPEASQQVHSHGGLRPSGLLHTSSLRGVFRRRHMRRVSCALTEEQKKGAQEIKQAEDADAVTRKWGLEAGLWKVLTSKDKDAEGNKENKGGQAKELLARYGSAYLITSITLSLISFSFFYALVSTGVDVTAVLSKVGIATDATTEKVGTVALAYAAHKASSPIRFPPTVALTPVVASLIGKKEPKEEEEQSK